MGTIPFLNLKAQLPQIREEIERKFYDIIDNTAFVSGKYVKEFEESFSGYVDVRHCVAVNNGTSALQLALLANGIGFGDEVIVPVNTFIATAEAVSLIGARPVFVDIDERTYNINVAQLESKVSKKTKAIIPVHLYGQCADMDGILEIAKKHNLIIVEDACQAHDAEYKKRKAGSIGRCAAFSFYPGKNLGAWGEGGAVVTSDDDLAEKVRLIRDHGSRKKYFHDIIGGNFRMSEFQGAVLSTKIKYLEEWNKKRRKNAELYLKLLKDNKNILLPVEENFNKHVWYLFVIRVKERNSFIKYLNEQSVQTGIHYPVPLHLTDAYKYLGHKNGDFLVAEKVQKEIVSLPMYPELSKEEIDCVANIINKYNF